MASGYWEVEMIEKDWPKTAFATRYALFEWNVMPFTFRILTLYLDDVVVFTDTVS